MKAVLKTAFQGGLFLGAAAGLHLLAMSVVSAPGGAAGAAGDAGTERMTLAAAPANLAALVQAWDSPPEVTPVVAAPPQPDQRPDQRLVDPAMTAPPQRLSPGPALPMPSPSESAQPPQMDTAPASPQPQAKPQKQTRPKPKPRPASDGSAGQKAAGKGQTGAAGQAKSDSASLSASQTRSLTAEWAGQIILRIERRKRYPSAARGREGVVSLRLTVGKDGALHGVAVTRSAGTPALDRAALQAVQKAGRFPAAPTGLTGASFTFDLKIRFGG